MAPLCIFLLLIKSRQLEALLWIASLPELKGGDDEGAGQLGAGTVTRRGRVGLLDPHSSQGGSRTRLQPKRVLRMNSPYVHYWKICTLLLLFFNLWNWSKTYFERIGSKSFLTREYLAISLDMLAKFQKNEFSIPGGGWQGYELHPPRPPPVKWLPYSYFFTQQTVL